MKSILIRAFGGRDIGYGHYYRCLSLAKAINRIDDKIDIRFLINGELENLIKKTGYKFIINDELRSDQGIVEKLKPNLFIFDSYLADDRYLKGIKQGTKLMLIDDNNDIYDSTIPDIIYNGNIHAKELGYRDVANQTRLLGLNYLIMKEEYWDGSTDDIDKEGVLITTGGTDKYGIMKKILHELKSTDAKLKVIIGPAYDDSYIRELEGFKVNNIGFVYKPNSLKEDIQKSKIAITAGGSTVYEILSLGTIPILFSMADNQDLICKTLKKFGIVNIGKYPKIEFSSLQTIVNGLLNKEANYGDLFSLLDGSGAMRVAKILLSII